MISYLWVVNGNMWSFHSLPFPSSRSHSYSHGTHGNSQYNLISTQNSAGGAYSTHTSYSWIYWRPFRGEKKGSVKGGKVRKTEKGKKGREKQPKINYWLRQSSVTIRVLGGRPQDGNYD